MFKTQTISGDTSESISADEEIIYSVLIPSAIGDVNYKAMAILDVGCKQKTGTVDSVQVNERWIDINENGEQYAKFRATNTGSANATFYLVVTVMCVNLGS